MELTIGTRNLALNEHVEQYARKRLAKLNRRLPPSVPVQLTLRHEKARAADERFIAEVTASLKNGLLRAEERSSTINSAIDAVAAVLDRQVRRYKTRRRRRRTALGEMEAQIAAQFEEDESADETLDESLEDGKLVRLKRHPVSPMTVSEAATQMDLVGHSFFVFLNSETRAVNVVYRRNDGDYGLIVPEPEGAGETRRRG